MIRMRKLTPLLLLASAPLLHPTPAKADWNSDLAAIDAQIRAVSGPAYQQGNAVNVQAGVTTASLEPKRVILENAGFNWFAPAGATGTYNYGNFYSFTGAPGQTDTQLRIVETTSATLLYRRGYPNEPTQRLGAWWGAAYLSPAATRDDLAVLAAWGNPLTGIYVISVPAGTRMITGLTSPMQAGAESRPGGATQYWLNSRDNNWLVHALYAPDYLGSYVQAVAGAQKLDRDATDSLAAQLRDIATANESGNSGAPKRLDSWFRATAGHSEYQPGLGGEVDARGVSYMLGTGMTVAGSASTARLHAGAMIGRSTLRQTAEASGVAGHLAANYGGLYAVYSRPATERFPWYASGAFLHGRVWFFNTVPGYLGRGLEQRYQGHMSSLSLECGVPLALGSGWTATPQVQIAATRVAQTDFVDELGAAVSLKQGDALYSRLGAQIDKTLIRRAGLRLSLWARASAVHNFCGNSEVEIAGEAVTGGRIEEIYQFDTGLRLDWAGRYSLRSSVGHSEGDERGNRTSASLNVAW